MGFGKTRDEVATLVKRYQADPGVVYDLAESELYILLDEMGELEPIVDVISGGQQQIHVENDTPIEVIKEVKPWWPADV